MDIFSETHRMVTDRELMELDAAILDLKELRKSATDEWQQRQDNMTDQEKRLERMQKFKWLVSPEMDKTKGPGWWAITEGSLLYTVRASSPDEAAAILDEHHEKEMGMGVLSFFFIDRLEDEVSEKFDATLEHESVVRLIPFSNAPWPENMNNLTDEQKAAIDYLDERAKKFKHLQ